MPNRILIVDDSALQATTRRLILERAGYQVVVVLDAREALERVAAESDFGLIITDHMMPSMTGADFVRSVRAMQLPVPIIVLSGLAEAEPEYADLDVEFGLKPMPPNDLLTTVSQLLDHGRGYLSA